MPASRTCSSVPASASTTVGPRPADGSSRISARGSVIRARAITSICCSPPDSVPASWARSVGEPREEGVGALATFGDERAVAADAVRAEVEVLVDAEAAEHAPSRRDVAQAVGGDPIRRRAREVIARERHGPAARALEPGDGLHRGGPARVVAGERDDLARADGDRQPLHARGHEIRDDERHAAVPR